MMELGIDRLFMDKGLKKKLDGARVAFLGHAASANRNGIHSLDILSKIGKINLVCGFGPQHGMRSEKQDNMIESDNYTDPVLNIPVFSLYSSIRRPGRDMMDMFDILVVDLQDIGARVYTYSTTLFYMLEACAEEAKQVWILDRPNPAGRAVEGTILETGYESFIGEAPLIMRHGLTLGELARWFTLEKKLDVDLHVVEMIGYNPDEPPGFGWPWHKLAWINPSPNASSVNMARCFPGTALIEGTTLSEGRGTTTPLEMAGAPGLDFTELLKTLEEMAPEWIKGAILRPCYFEPAFDKHRGYLCAGFQIHTDHPLFNPYVFKPYRMIAGLLKSIRKKYPDYDLWRLGPFEYEEHKMAIDLLSGSHYLRTWVDDPTSEIGDLEKKLLMDEKAWLMDRQKILCY